jgi:histidine triad (HIT) family protein
MNLERKSFGQESSRSHAPVVVIVFALCYTSVGGLVSRIISCAAVVSKSSSFSNFSGSTSSSKVTVAAFLPVFYGGSSFQDCSSSTTTTTTTTTTRLAMSSAASDEVSKAVEAAKVYQASDTDGAGPATVFDKLLSGEWPTDKLFEDDQCLAFRDVNPQAPIHFLVIPKHRNGLTQLSKARDDQKALLGHLLYVAQQVGQKECPNGFRVTINDGADGAQSVYHLHVHVMGGRQMEWPPG